MATTRRMSVKSNAGPALAYIKNGEKAELVTGINCSVEFAKEEFEAVSDGSTGNVKAYHTIQSFSPEDKVTPEIAHEIGVKLAREIYGDYQCVVSTHTDKGHIHNHIISNSTSFLDHRKMKDKLYNGTSINRIHEVSDQLCSEYNLSVLPEHKVGRYPHMHVSTSKNRPYREMKIRLKMAVIRNVPKCRNEKELMNALGEEGFRFKNGKISCDLFRKPHYYKIKSVIGKNFSDYYGPPKKKTITSKFAEKILNKIKKPRLPKIKAYIGHFLEYTSRHIHDFKAETAISDNSEMTRTEMNTDRNKFLNQMQNINQTRKGYEKLLKAKKKYFKYKKYYDAYHTSNAPILLGRNAIQINKFEEARDILHKAGYTTDESIKQIRNDYLAFNRQYNKIQNSADKIEEKLNARDLAMSYECGEFRILKARAVGFRDGKPIVPVSDRFMKADRFVKVGDTYLIPIEEARTYTIEKKGEDLLKIKGSELFDYIKKDRFNLSREIMEKERQR